VPNIARLSEEEVLTIRRQMARTLLARKDAFGQTEPLYPDRLSSAVHRQHVAAGGHLKYDTIPDVAATLFFGIANNHAFENGNKRTALVILLVFIDKNRSLLIDTTEEDLYQLATRLVKHEIAPADSSTQLADAEVTAVSRWIRERVRTRVLGDRKMRFSELRSLLVGLGCTFDGPEQNFIKIHRGRWMCRTGYPKIDFEVGVNEVKRIRKALRLDEVHGVDSRGFYDLAGQVDRFVNDYRNLMRRLADI